MVTPPWPGESYDPRGGLWETDLGGPYSSVGGHALRKIESLARAIRYVGPRETYILRIHHQVIYNTKLDIYQIDMMLIVTVIR